MATVRIPDDLNQRLTALARATKRPKSFYLREALERCLEDIEDAYLAEAALEEHLASGKEGISLKDMMAKYGMEH